MQGTPMRIYGDFHRVRLLIENIFQLTHLGYILGITRPVFKIRPVGFIEVVGKRRGNFFGFIIKFIFEQAF